MPKGKKPNAKKKTHTRAAGKSRTPKRAPGRAEKLKNLGGEPLTRAEIAAFNRNLPGRGSSRAAPTARILFRKKRTFQLTETLARERVDYKAVKGRKPVSSKENAARILRHQAAKAKGKFSRKKSNDGTGKTRYTARATLKWKNQEGKWVRKSISYVGTDLESAIEGLLLDDELESLTSGNAEMKTERAIASKTKRIVGVSFDKYVERKHRAKVPASTKGKKAKPQKARHVRHRK